MGATLIRVAMIGQGCTRMDGMNDELIIEKLDELIAATKASSIPMKDRWVDSTGKGALLWQKPRYVLERMACLPGFPEPLRVDQPRWKASEAMEWAEHCRRQGGVSSRRGRPRRRDD